MSYLSNHQVLATRDVDDFREQIVRVAGPHRIDVRGGRDGAFDATLAAAPLGAVTLGYADYGRGADTLVGDGGVQTDALLVCLPTRGGGIMHQGGDSWAIRAGSGLVRDMRRPMTGEMMDSAVLFAALPLDALTRRVAALFGIDPMAAGRLSFAPVIDGSSTEGRHLIRALTWVAEELNGPLGLAGNPLAAANLEAFLLGQVLALQPNTATEALAVPPRADALPRHSARAREYIQANADGPITIEDLARHAGCGYRTLQATFRESFGMPPMAYLKVERLERARRRLEEGVPVKRVAWLAGYAHASNFTLAFRRHFGVAPATHARRRRGD